MVLTTLLRAPNICFIFQTNFLYPINKINGFFILSTNIIRSHLPIFLHLLWPWRLTLEIVNPSPAEPGYVLSANSVDPDHLASSEAN